MRPKWVIPCNWGYGTRSATRLEAQMFAGQVEKEAEVLLMQPDAT
jgi:hypothetical protein